MITTFAHAARTETMETMNNLEYNAPIIVGMGIVILLLLSVILYMTVTWQPKSFAALSKKPVASAKKKTTKK